MSPPLTFYRLLGVGSSTTNVATVAETVASQLIGPLLIGVFLNVWLYGMMLMRELAPPQTTFPTRAEIYAEASLRCRGPDILQREHQVGFISITVHHIPAHC